MKKAISIVLSVILSFSLLASPAFAATPTPDHEAEEYIQTRYSRITSFAVGLEISSSGLANCYSKVKLTYSTDTVILSNDLQKLSNGSWESVKSWSTSGSGTVSLDKDWYVSSGYSYRVVATAKVYNSSGTLQETAPVQAEMVGLVDKCVKTSSGADAYDEQFKALADKIKALQAKLDAVGSQGSDADNSRLSEILAAIEGKDFDLSHYDDSLVRLLVENITVVATDSLKIRFKEFGMADVSLP